MSQAYKLLHPIQTTFNPGTAEERVEEITEITLRPAKAKDLRILDSQPGEMAGAIAMLARLSGQPVKIIDELSAEDFGKLAELMKGF